MSNFAKVILALCLMVGAYVAGNLANRQPAAAASSAASRQVLYWTCPMHPQYRSDHPGDAPCCGMRLEPVYAGAQPTQADAALPKGAVEIGVAQQQLIGIRTDEVKRAPASHLLRVPGRITVDEGRLYRLIAAVDGWIREIGPNSAGTSVRQNQVLASYYARDFLSAQQALLYAMNKAAQLQMGQPLQSTQASLNYQIAVDGLRSLGMNDLQINEFQRTQVSLSQIHIYSPVTGFVIARNVSPQQRFEKGAELYRIADIGHLWVVTDIFEKDREFLRPGAAAVVHYQSREFPARMSDVLPQFDAQSRTLKTRFELDNPGYILRPDVFVDVELHVTLPATVTVPADSVIDTGRRNTVFVKTGAGIFEPRFVETGWRLGDRVQITNGLVPGERIVVSGNFLIDSESRMKLAGVSAPPATADAAAETDPVCGMEVKPATAAGKSEYKGKTYYFCSGSCKKKFDADPQKYLPKEKAPGRGAKAA